MKLAYIDSDADGFGVRLILSKLYNDINYRYTSIRKLENEISYLYNTLQKEKYDTVIIADLSLEHVYKDVIKCWVKFKFKLVYIDHHPFNIDILKKVADKYDLKLSLIYTTKYCSAMNLYNKVKNNKKIKDNINLKRTIEVIDVFDTDKDTNKKYKILGTYLNNKIFKDGINNFCVNYDENYIFSETFINHVKKMQNKVKNYFKELQETNKLFDFGDVLWTFQDDYFSNTKLIFPDKKIYIMSTTWGSVYMRININAPEDELKKMKETFIEKCINSFNCKGGGHVNAFSVTIDKEEYNLDTLNDVVQLLVDIYKDYIDEN